MVLFSRCWSQRHADEGELNCRVQCLLKGWIPIWKVVDEQMYESPSDSVSGKTARESIISCAKASQSRDAPMLRLMKVAKVEIDILLI